MRLLTLRLTISLIVGITLISLFSAYYEVRSQRQGFRRDLEHRAEVLGESLADKVEPYLKKGSHKDLQATVERFANRAKALERRLLEAFAMQRPLHRQTAPTRGFRDRSTARYRTEK